MMSCTARQASSLSRATMTPFPAASPLAFTTSAGKSALDEHRGVDGHSDKHSSQTDPFWTNPSLHQFFD